MRKSLDPIEKKVDKLVSVMFNGFIVALILISVFSCMSFYEGRGRQAHEDQVTAVKHGAAHWVTSTEGTPSFHWNDETETAEAKK